MGSSWAARAIREDFSDALVLKGVKISSFQAKDLGPGRERQEKGRCVIKPEGHGAGEAG